MPTYSLPYGRGSVEFQLSESLSADVILPPEAGSIPEDQIDAQICAAIARPIGEKTLADFRTARSVGIAVNDKTRPVPNDIYLPPLFDALRELGIPKSSIRIFIANGTHVPMPPADYHRILPQNIIDQYAILSHDCDDESNLIRLGSTSRGTQVAVNRQFFECDLKIVTGNIEPHHFAGFSGGMKTASIGLGSRSTINKNHAMLVDPNAMIGVYEQNPLRQDIEEIGEQFGVQFALNAVMSGERTMAGILFGEPLLVMQAGIPIAQKIFQTPVHGKYDLVVASAGGHPKDINLYQAQKAMTHASLLARPGGCILLVAACPEGSGSASYEAYMAGISSHQEVLSRFKQDGFRVGPHKSFQIASIATRFDVVLVSNIPDATLARLLLASATSVQEAVDRVIKNRKDGMRIAVLPHATSTIPIIV